ncbi:MAG: ArnT family glycosyltransferase [Candidatus Dojkabacteria bacterium]
MTDNEAVNVPRLKQFRLSVKVMAVFLFFLAYLVAGILSYKDYGFSTDEGIQRNHGLVSARYLADTFNLPQAETGLLSDKEDLETYEHKFYGVAFHIPLLIGERVVGVHHESAEMWEFRHVCTFLFFYIGVIFLYLTLMYRFKDWRLALLGCVMMVLSPRIFAESFYNIKDTTFLAAFTIALYFASRFLIEKKVWLGVFAALSIGFAINIRILAVIIPIVVLGMITIELFKSKQRKSIVVKSLLFIILTLFCTYLFWPAAWNSPINTFVDAFLLMSKYERWNGHIIYMGEIIRGAEVPWHYIPVWIAVTTPIVYLLLFGVGVLQKGYNIVRDCISGKIFKRDSMLDILFLILLFGPVIAVIVFNSTLYGGWRHLYFIYGLIIIFAVSGFKWIFTTFQSLFQQKQLWSVASKGAVLFLIFATFAHSIFWMTANHPYQFVYFNQLAGDPANDFDRDYWRVSARDALRFITKNDSREHIYIEDSGFIRPNAFMLSSEERQRLKFISPEEDGVEAHYKIIDYRLVQGNYEGENEIYSIEVDGFKIMSVIALE